MSRPEGIPAAQLADDDLERELAHLHETRHATVLDGTRDALERHTRRMLEVEEEYRQRFPGRAGADPDRTRAGARARAGQEPAAPSACTSAAAPPLRAIIEDDLLPGSTLDDTDAGWGDRSETDQERLRRYLAERPPHHGD